MPVDVDDPLLVAPSSVVVEVAWLVDSELLGVPVYVADANHPKPAVAARLAIAAPIVRL